MNLTAPSAEDIKSSDGRNTRHEGRRRELMDDAVQYVLSHGLSDLSIRPMAEALGISHRTLLHHFGSKEEMVERVLAEVRLKHLQHLREQAQKQKLDALSMLDEAWAQQSAPERLPFWRGFFEIYAIAAKNPERHAEFLDGIIKAWLPMWITSLVGQGLTKAKAEALATMVHACCRGLLIDLLTTEDHARVARAYKLLRGILEQEIAAAR
ncbi:MAG: TetR/AcrR family transcriptional regulator [Nevskia sp.]|nr:TetR/AcrR family transcriptional regulator [Nevskia sp.]